MSSLLLINAPRAALPWLDELASEGVQLLETRPENLRESLDQMPQVDAAIIGSSVPAPVAIARTLHAAKPDAHIVFVTDDNTERGLRRELMFAPRIGRLWTIIQNDTRDRAVGAVRSALERSTGQRTLRTTLNHLNTRLAAPATGPAPRRFISDHFVASVFNQLSDAVIMLDANDVVITSNAAAARALGRSPAQGEPISSVISRRIEDGQQSEVEAKNAAGERIVLEVRREPVFDADGSRVGSTVVARDVTERRRAQERSALLSAATERLSETLDVQKALGRLAALVTESLADLCVVDVVTPGGIAREAAAASASIGPEVAQTLSRFAPRGANHPAVSALRRAVTRLETNVTDEQWRELTANEEHYAITQRLRLHSFITAPLKAGRRVLGALTLVRGGDSPPFTSPDKEFVEELARRAAIALHNAWLYQAAEQGNRAKDEFLATLSHELRTPMTSIVGWVQLLRLGGLSEEEVAEGIEVIHQSARVQAQLIDDLLDVSRIESGKLHLETERLDLSAVIRGAVETLRPAAEAKRVTVEVEASDEFLVLGDPNRLQQVFWNLLSNAVKFSERGGHVRVSTAKNGSRAEAIITDRGAGIAPDFLPYVFDRFRQADSATTRRFGGLGLGLAIVKQIVELHGGTVMADSEGKGLGATFTVSLPIASVNEAARESESKRSLARLKGYSVLVVEDDRASASTIRAVLRRAGASVEVRHSVAEALDSLRSNLPDVVISDLAMPEQDGYALIQQMRGTLRIPRERVPAIALTALGDIPTRVKLLGAGFERHLQKPADPDALTSCIADVLTKKKQPE